MSLLTYPILAYPLWLWLMFLLIVLFLLAFDLGVLHKDQQAINIRDSIKLSLFYIGVGLAFGAWLGWYQGTQAGIEYFTGYLIEKSLSMDNIFVISLIFNSLAIPRHYQHRVLFWGILGVIIMRALMIGLGAYLVTQFQWVLLLFGIFLIITGCKMLRSEASAQQLDNNRLYQCLRRYLRFTPQLHQHHFWVRGEAHGLSPGWWATPLFLALLMIESADLVFAVDSIPAIFAITKDPFIVYTSNIFAVLGLRALYFALAAMMHRFHYLKYSLSLILIFIGSKVGLSYFHERYDLPISISSTAALGVTLALLAAGIAYSLYKTR